MNSLFSWFRRVQQTEICIIGGSFLGKTGPKIMQGRAYSKLANTKQLDQSSPLPSFGVTQSITTNSVKNRSYFVSSNHFTSTSNSSSKLEKQLFSQYVRKENFTSDARAT